MNEASVDIWVKVITGSAGALGVMIWWIKTLQDQIKQLHQELGATIEKKDARINEITDKAVSAIATISAASSGDAQWKRDMLSKIEEIKTIVGHD
jgi:hypothetical protein